MENKITTEEQFRFLTEEQFQAACVLWYTNAFRLQQKRLVCVDNNPDKRTKGMNRIIEGQRKKAMGVRPGASDMYFIGFMFVAFIELKLENGTQSPEQKEFQATVNSLGHMYFIIKPPLLNFQNLIWKLMTQNQDLQVQNTPHSIGK